MVCDEFGVTTFINRKNTVRQHGGFYINTEKEHSVIFTFYVPRVKPAAAESHTDQYVRLDSYIIHLEAAYETFPVQMKVERVFDGRLYFSLHPTLARQTVTLLMK